MATPYQELEKRRLELQNLNQQVGQRYSGMVEAGVFVGPRFERETAIAQQRKAQLAQQQLRVIERMKGSTRMYTPLVRLQQRKAERATAEYSRRTQQEYEAYKRDVEGLESGGESFNKQVDEYNRRQQELSNYLQKVAEGRESVEDITIRTGFKERRGRTIGYYYSSRSSLGDRYSEGETQNITPGGLEQWAIEGTRSYLNLGPEDIIRLNDKVIQESAFTPEEISVANQVFASRKTALEQYKREQELEQDRLKTGWGFAQKDAAQLKAVYDRAASLTPTKQAEALKEQLKGSYAKEVVEGTRWGVGGVSFSKPEMAERYAAQLDEKLLKSYQASQTPEYGRARYDIWEMPTEINPATGKRYTAPDPEFKARARYIERTEWYDKLNKPEKALALIGGSLMDFGVASTFIQKNYGSSIKSWEQKHIPNVSKLASFLTGFEPMSGFELESASIGEGTKKRTTTYTYTELSQKDILASKLYNVYDKDEVRKPFLDRVGTGLYKGATSNAILAVASAYGIGLAAGGVGRGIAAVSSARTANLAVKGAGYFIATVVAADVSLKTLAGNVGEAAVEGGVFATTLPIAAAGFRLSAGIPSQGLPVSGWRARLETFVRRYPGDIEIPEGLAPGKAIKFEAGARLSTKLGTMEPLTTKPLDFTQVKALGEFGKDVEAWIKANPQQKPVVGGSAAARAQFAGARRPGDIDIDVVDPARAALSLYPKAQKFFGKENVGLELTSEWGQATIEIYGRHGIQFLPKTPVGEFIGQHSGLPFKSGRPIEIGGVKFKPANELFLRKADSILRQQGRTIGPQPHRLKDIVDFKQYANEFIAAKKAAADRSGWLLRGYRSGKVEDLKKDFETYKLYSGLDVYPVVVKAARYAAREPGGLIGAGVAVRTIPTIKEYLKEVGRHEKNEYTPLEKYPETKSVTTTYPKVTTTYPKTTMQLYPPAPPTHKQDMKYLKQIYNYPGKYDTPPTSPHPKTTYPQTTSSKYSPRKQTRSTSKTPTPKKLTFSAFKDTIENARRKRKRRYKWDIENPVPTFESLFGG